MSASRDLLRAYNAMTLQRTPSWARPRAWRRCELCGVKLYLDQPERFRVIVGYYFCLPDAERASRAIR